MMSEQVSHTMFKIITQLPFNISFCCLKIGRRWFQKPSFWTLIFEKCFSNAWTEMTYQTPFFFFVFGHSLMFKLTNQTRCRHFQMHKIFYYVCFNKKYILRNKHFLVFGRMKNISNKKNSLVKKKKNRWSNKCFLLLKSGKHFLIWHIFNKPLQVNFIHKCFLTHFQDHN